MSALFEDLLFQYFIVIMGKSYEYMLAFVHLIYLLIGRESP
jgi:hypothetical protein